MSKQPDNRPLLERLRKPHYVTIDGVDLPSFAEDVMEEAAAEIERLRAALEPFLRFYDDIRFNLRKQPHPFDPAVVERGERNASLTWADFYNLRDAMRAPDEQSRDEN